MRMCDGPARDALIARGLTKTYRTGAGPVRAVDGVDLEAKMGEVTVIFGPSGSGKSTLLYLLGSLERPDSGYIWAFGEEITAPRIGLEDFRTRRVGFVFQFFHLIPYLTALENVLLPMELAGSGREQARRRAVELLRRVGVEEKLYRSRAGKLSGGEKQRVAIARAVANDPALVLADEPTGNLDSDSGAKVVSLLADLAHREGKCVVIVTHDEGVLRVADRCYRMVDGKLDLEMLPATLLPPES